MATTFPFHIDRRVAPLLRLLGVREDERGRTQQSTGSGVTLTDDAVLIATFGRFRVQTPLANIASVERTGPYRLWKVTGLRLSIADWGLTFGTTSRGGACLLFHEPVGPVIGWRPHPGLTVTVADPDGFVAAVDGARTT